MSRDWQLVLADIIEHAERVGRLLEDRDLDSFERDETLRQAVLFSLLVIGEASKRLPQFMRDAEPSVNWRGAAGLRDIIVHQYFGLDPELTWDAASVHVPRLLEAARRLQASANPGTDVADGADVGEGEQRDD